MKTTTFRSSKEFFFDCPYCGYTHLHQSFMLDDNFLEGGQTIECENESCNKKFKIAKHGNDTGWFIT